MLSGRITDTRRIIMLEKFKKSNSFNEPDDIMLMDDDDFSKAYDIEVSDDRIFELESQINDLVYQKEELESDNNNMQFILNNEVVDYYRANELFDEIKYNQIEILKIEQKLAKLKAKYDKLTQSTYQR